jgi:hypothetical protein
MTWKEWLGTSAARFAGLVVVMTIATPLSAHFAYTHGFSIAERWTNELQPKLQLIDDKTTHFCVVPGTTPGSASARLEQDYREIRSRMAHHLAVLEYFYANYFRAIFMGSILGAISGVCLFYIANKGWTNSNNYVIVVFVFTTVTTAYYLSYVTIFREQENISDNKVLYLQYVALGNDILTYCSTGLTDDPQVSIDKYARQVDTRMATVNNIAIGFDYTKIADYKQILSERRNTQPAGPGNKP